MGTSTRDSSIKNIKIGFKSRGLKWKGKNTITANLPQKQMAAKQANSSALRSTPF